MGGEKYQKREKDSLIWNKGKEGVKQVKEFGKRSRWTMLGEKKFRSGGTERGRRRKGRMNVRSRINKPEWMNADRQFKRLLRGRMIEKLGGLRGCINEKEGQL